MSVRRQSHKVMFTWFGDAKFIPDYDHKGQGGLRFGYHGFLSRASIVTSCRQTSRSFAIAVGHVYSKDRIGAADRLLRRYAAPDGHAPDRNVEAVAGERRADEHVGRPNPRQRDDIELGRGIDQAERDPSVEVPMQ
jgi:hypothetical protein